MKFAFGSDPEFMLSNKTEIVSAIGILPSRKKCKKIDGNYFYFDNVLAECTVQPAANRQEAIDNIHSSLKTLSSIVKPLTITLKASHHYDPKFTKHPEAQKISCSPEADIYTKKVIVVPNNVFKKSNQRTAGGHIHVGCKFFSLSDQVSLVKMMDVFLGIPSLFLDKDETAKERKILYGKAGRFRQKKYGIEYRSLGNFWLASPKTVSLIYDLTEFSIQFVKDKRHEQWWKGEKCIGYNIKELRNTIDNSDLDKANHFLDNLLKPQLPSDLYEALFDEMLKKQSYSIKEEWKL